MANLSSISKGPRQSNFELLRIIAMFLVLMVHADFYTLGTPGQEDFASSPVNAVTRTVFQAISIVCVNVFILISGWFRIRSSLKGFLNLIFQCAFFYGGYYIIAVVTGYSTLSLGSIVYALCPDSNGISWFIVAYIALYILSPILNSFLENSSKKQIEIFLVSFYLFQTVYTIYIPIKYISHGFSPFSFIGLYVLANYLNVYKLRFYKLGGVIYILSVVAITTSFIVEKNYGIGLDSMSYSNPFVVIGAVGLLLWASQLKIEHNKYINWISKSVFAVYLFHIPKISFPNAYVAINRKLYENYSGIEYLGLMLAVIIAFFITAILLDKPRIWLWNRLVTTVSKIYFRKDA